MSTDREKQLLRLQKRQSTPACSHSTDLHDLPPDLNVIASKSPALKLHRKLDRSIQRCRLCDLLVANNRQADAQSPGGLWVTASIDNEIRIAEELIEQGVRRDELKAALPRMNRERDRLIRAMEKGVRTAWEEYWAIWGLDTEEGADIRCRIDTGTEMITKEISGAEAEDWRSTDHHPSILDTEEGKRTEHVYPLNFELDW